MHAPAGSSVYWFRREDMQRHAPVHAPIRAAAHVAAANGSSGSSNQMQQLQHHHQQKQQQLSIALAVDWAARVHREGAAQPQGSSCIRSFVDARGCQSLLIDSAPLHRHHHLHNDRKTPPSTKPCSCAEAVQPVRMRQLPAKRPKQPSSHATCSIACFPTPFHFLHAASIQRQRVQHP